MAAYARGNSYAECVTLVLSKRVTQNTQQKRRQCLLGGCRRSWLKSLVDGLRKSIISCHHVPYAIGCRETAAPASPSRRVTIKALYHIISYYEDNMAFSFKAKNSLLAFCFGLAFFWVTFGRLFNP